MYTVKSTYLAGEGIAERQDNLTLTQSIEQAKIMKANAIGMGFVVEGDIRRDRRYVCTDANNKSFCIRIEKSESLTFEVVIEGDYLYVRRWWIQPRQADEVYAEYPYCGWGANYYVVASDFTTERDAQMWAKEHIVDGINGYGETVI